MELDRGVLGLYTNGPIGMDHPYFMARTEARMLAAMAAAAGLPLGEALIAARARVLDLFGDVPLALIDATVATTYLAAAAAQGDRHGD